MDASTIGIIFVAFLVFALGGSIIEKAKKAGERHAESTNQDRAQTAKQYENRATGIYFGLVAVIGLLVYANWNLPSSTDALSPSSSSAAVSGDSPRPRPSEAKTVAEPNGGIKERGYRIAYDVIGCQDFEIYDRRIKYAVEGDREAFAQLSAVGLATGQCKTLKKGEKIFLDEWGFASKKVRPAGKQSSYWVVTEAVETVEGAGK